MESLRAEIFGGLRFRLGDSTVDLRGAKRRQLAAMLVANANTPVHVDRLVDLLDPSRTEADSLNALQAQIRRLRMVIEPQRCASQCVSLTTDSDTYRLRVDEMDLWEFRFLVRSARSQSEENPLQSMATYQRALARWKEPFGAIGTGDGFIEIVRSLELERLTVEDEWIGSALKSAKRREAQWLGSSNRESCEALIDLVIEAADREPLREPRTALAVQLLYLAGRQAEALRIFSQTRHALREELGVSPGPQLAQIWDQVLRQDHRLLDDDSRAQHALSTRPIDAGPICSVLSGLAMYRGQVSLVGAARETRSRLLRRWVSTQDIFDRVEWVDWYSANQSVVDSKVAQGSPDGTVGIHRSVRPDDSDRDMAIVLDIADLGHGDASRQVVDLRVRRPRAFVIVSASGPIGLRDENVIRVPRLVAELSDRSDRAI